ncbi:hypothetical protein [Aquimarina algiphila]|uniref:hypothetical protein n=1 Tax=Aquimarina algiphila TaxID=2047982 RepID=UPI002490245A|nr:hypothetical protein [Aquimarina algiphila]
MMLSKELIYILFICSSLTVSCQEKNKKDDTNKETRSYLIHKIDSTKRYFVLGTTVKNDSVTLVIFKKSKQLKKRKVKVNELYSFETYRWSDAIGFHADYFHIVDEIEIWNTDMKNVNLHFTDGMGNGYLESDEELEYKN